MTQTFSGTQAADVVGITYRRLDYWARTDLVRPSGTDAAGVEVAVVTHIAICLNCE